MAQNPFDYIQLFKAKQRAQAATNQTVQQQQLERERKRIVQLNASRSVVVARVHHFVFPLLDQLRDAAYQHMDISKYWSTKYDRQDGIEEMNDYAEWTIQLRTPDTIGEFQSIERGGTEYVVTVHLEFVDGSDAVKSFTCWSKANPKVRHITMTAESLTRALVDMHPLSDYKI